MSARKCLMYLFVTVGIALAAATSFAPCAHAAAEIDERAHYDLLADALERVVEIYERYDTGDPDNFNKVRHEIYNAQYGALRFFKSLYIELCSVYDISSFTFTASYIELMEESFLIEPGSLSAGSKLSDLAGFDDFRQDLVDLYETVRCLQHFLADEYEAMCFKVPFANRISYLQGAIEALRSGSVSSFNTAVRQAQFTGTIEASGDDVAIDAAVPAILAGVTGIAVGAAGFAIASHRRRS